MSKILKTIIKTCAEDCPFCSMFKNEYYCDHPIFGFMEKKIEYPYREIPDFCLLEDYKDD